MVRVRRLSEIGRDDLPLAGGKGANLGAMIGLGLPVPEGFVVTAPTYMEQVADWNLPAVLAPLVGREAWDESAQAAEELLLARPLEQGLVSDVLTAYRELGSPAVAVRSSATAEDLADSSFAGQQETFLNVQGEEELLQAIRRCWASLWSPRAMHYRQMRGIDHATVAMAVVVQVMVPAEVAGVLFTVDPVAQRADRILLEAARGLGEAIVSGQATGQVYRVERTSLTIAERDGEGAPVLTPEQVTQLCRLALRSEEYYGCPQDLEFAIAGGEIFLLQTRPITTLSGAQPEEIPPVGKLTAFQRSMEPLAAERYSAAPKPLDNLVYPMLVGAAVYALRESAFWVDEEGEADLRRRVWHPHYILPNGRPTVRTLTGLPGHIRRTLERDWQGWWWIGPQERLLRVTAPVDLREMDDVAITHRAEEIMAVWTELMNRRFVASGMMMVEGWLQAGLGLLVGKEQAPLVVNDLLGGLRTTTTETNEALWHLSRRVREHEHLLAIVRDGEPERLAESKEGRALQAEVERFLQIYGHREGSCWYLSVPVLRRDPTRFWALLKAMAETEQMPRTEVEVAGARLLVERKLRWVPPLRSLVFYLVDRLRTMRQFRENSHFDLTRPLAALQDLADEWARRLAERGLLRSPDDLFYLTFAEVKAWLTGEAPGIDVARALIARRRATYQVVNGSWQAHFFKPGASGSRLKGIGASPGVVRARARIIRDESQFHRLKPGEVMLCRYTNPAWTPLFVTAAAVVAELGGAGSHAAIVAREYGIPAVMGVSGLLSAIEDGQEILVDGGKGLVLVAQ